MAAFDKADLFDVIIQFLSVRDSPSPIPEELHVGLASEHDLMCKLFSGITSGHAVAAGGAPADPEDINSARDEFLGSIVRAAGFIAAQRASTSHI